MFSEILKIIPRISPGDASNMERTLSKRFQNVAKKFGSGLVGALKTGSLLAIGASIIDKIVNPLQAVQESIDKALNSGDDLSTYAKQFNTTAGNLARLQAFGTASGLDAEGLRMLLVKFQSAVATSASKPGEQTAVSNFVGKADTAESFFEFVQSLQKLSPTQQNLVQQEVFGERQILKASEFLNQNFAQLNATLGGPSAQQLTYAAEKLGALSDLRDVLKARRDLKDLNTKSELIGPKTIGDLAKGEDIEVSRENKRLAQFDDLKRISMATDKLLKIVEDAYLKLAPAIGQYLPQIVESLAFSAKAVEKSRAVRGMIPGAGKDN